MFEDTGGFAFNFPANTITDPIASNNPAPRNTVNFSIEDTLSRQWSWRGDHSMSMGGSFQRVEHNQNGLNAVQQLDFGVDQNFDPAAGMFNTTNFAGASNQNLTDARALYAVLTGRITQVVGTARLNAAGDQYVYLGNLYQKSRMDSFDMYVQDSWRLTPTVTLNYGARYDIEIEDDVEEGLADEIVALIVKMADQADAIVLQDYNKGVMVPAIVTTAIRAANAAGKPIVVDSAATDPQRRAVIVELLRLILAQNGGILFLQQVALIGSVYGFVDVLVKLVDCEHTAPLPGACTTQDLGQPPACGGNDDDWSQRSTPAPHLPEPPDAASAPREDLTPPPPGEPSRTSAADNPPLVAQLARMAAMVRFEVVEPARPVAQPLRVVGPQAIRGGGH
jgi:hypothetical protein